MENENIKQFLEMSKQFGEEISNIFKDINVTLNLEMADWVKEACAKLSSISFDISGDIREKELFAKLNSIDPLKAIHKENIEWIIKDYTTLDEALSDFGEDIAFLDSDIGEYIKDIVFSNGMEKREKIVVLLAHMEPLIRICLGNNLKAGKGIRGKVNNTVMSRLDSVTTGNIGRIYILAITKVIFAKTDEFTDDIDKRIPFRNYILHNGIYTYCLDDVEEMYFILVVFIKMILISGWAIKEEA